MYSKLLLSNLTLGQDNLLFLGINLTHTDFTGLTLSDPGYLRQVTILEDLKPPPPPSPIISETNLSIFTISCAFC